MATKIALVQAERATFGLGPALAALHLARSTWYYRQTAPVPYVTRIERQRSSGPRVP